MRRVALGCDCPDCEERRALKDARNSHAVALGKLGASKGGKARARKLSKQRLSDIGRGGAEARWSMVKPCPVCRKRHRSEATACKERG